MKVSFHDSSRRFLLIFFAAFFFACATACHSSGKEAAPDFLAADVDSTVSPSTDFFSYANGAWLKKNPIPASESSWGIGDLVEEDIYNRLRKINESEKGKTAPTGSVDQQIGDFWYSGMDSAGMEQEKLAPLSEGLQEIARSATKNDLVTVAADFHRIGVPVLFNDGAGQDDKNSALIVFGIVQGGLGLPNRDYYFKTDARTVGVRNAYRLYQRTAFAQMGGDSVEAARVFALETRLAAASRKLADLRDPYKNYHKMTVAALTKLSGDFRWARYLKASGLETLDSVLVGQPEFLATLGREWKSTSLADWKSYFRFHLFRVSAPYLDSATYNNYFFYQQTLSGASEPRPRWKRVLDAEESVMGEALGQLFVRDFFDAKAKARYSLLVKNIRDAYKERIARLAWMSESTRRKAREKLDKVIPKVGYPDKWKDFRALKIDRGPFLSNVQRGRAWWRAYNLAKLGKPVDRTEWDMTPQTYNAYYNPGNNEIVLPAGMFIVPGKADSTLDDAFVYGYAAASTIGHEITHGFDDEGRQYDAEGNLRGWWLPADSVAFTRRTEKIIREFNAFNPVDTLHVNGEATQGENIADLGGLVLGLDAFKKTAAYASQAKIGGFTPLQRYFLGYAFSWLFQERKETLARQLMTDVHSPSKERVNGPLVNIPEFYEAFGIKPGTPMYRPDSLRVKIW